MKTNQEFYVNQRRGDLGTGGNSCEGKSNTIIRTTAGIITAAVVALLLAFASSPVSDSEIIKTVFLSPEVVTKDASEVMSHSAILNGELKSVGEGNYVAVFWEWGNSTDFGNETAPQVMTSPGTYSVYLSGLQPETEYYFRSVASNINRTYGNVISFTTKE